ncbi:MAG: HlyC/CorC family transporter [Lachnospiraceae bacterium]|nr:HlyC/CorC family transporter [Lachnospiraceae bacterium]
MIGIYIAAIAFCVILSAFFSASEMAYSSANEVRLENLSDKGNGSAGRAVRILEKYDNLISTILVGNNLVNIAASSLGSVAVILLAGEAYAWLSTIIITITVIIFGETIPKICAKKNANRLALLFSAPLRALMLLFFPVTWVVVRLVELMTKRMKGDSDAETDAADELHTIIETAESEEVLDEDSSELVSAAIDFPETPVSEVMTARVDLIAVDADDDWDEIRQTVTDAPFSRIPVYEDSIDNIIGVLSVKHFLKRLLDEDEFDIREMLMPAVFVYKTMKLPAILDRLRGLQQHLAIVTDEYGGTLGAVSLEDIMEDLVGEIWDEKDVIEEDIHETDENTFIIDGDTPLSDLAELMDWDEDYFDFESETVGGWCIEVLGEFPSAGDTFTYENASVRILEADERRVLSIELAREQAAEETE